MIVIKLGGSLSTSGTLLECLNKIECSYCNENVIIVPGGGLFADQVRTLQQQWQFGNNAAHQMAILAMQQMALAFNALKPEFTMTCSITQFHEQTNNNGVTIWSPIVSELDAAGIPSNWDITSDSLSAWLAKTLNVDQLILVKSVKINTNLDIQKLTQQQIVDASFHEFIKETSFQLSIIYAKDFLSKP